MTSGAGSAWAKVAPVPPDAIFGMKAKFQDDPSGDKIDLTVGSYSTDEGEEYLLPSVRAAEVALASSPTLSHGYLKITGDPTFVDLAMGLAFGESASALREKRVAGVQSLSGTGALRLLATFIARAIPGKPLLVSRPTWGNHVKIFHECGIEQRGYRYWEPRARALDLAGMLADMRKAPRGSIVLLHVCAHNPTGVDPTHEQWEAICDLMLEMEHVAFFDMAYQGYATGDLDDDAYALRLFVKRGVRGVVLAQSFAKNMGLYGERVGCCSVVCASQKEATAVKSNLAAIVRPMYSNPPRHGAEVVKHVLGRPASRAAWILELKRMAARIAEMRVALHAELKKLQTPGDWGHVLAQIGMFCYTGLTEKQVRYCIENHHVYLLNSGRISVAGLNTGNVARVARAFDATVRRCPPAAAHL